LRCACMACFETCACMACLYMLSAVRLAMLYSRCTPLRPCCQCNKSMSNT
jgi:hypothetical protein